MKKTLLLIAAALISVASFGQTVTKVSSDGSNNTFKLPSNSHVYAIFKFNDGMKKAIGIDDTQYTYIGEDAEQGRNLWNWQSTAKTPGGPQSAAPNKDSFGQVAQFYNMAGATGWSGWGLNIDKSHPIDLSQMFDPNAADAEKWGFHFAIKQTKRSANSTPTVTITDGDGHTAEFKFGTGNGELNVPADGNWYSVDINCFDLLDLYGVDFSTPANKTYSDKNLFTFSWGASPDDFCVDYAAFFYGPGNQSTGIETINDNHNPKSSGINSNNVYTLSGQRVSENDLAPGIYIKNGKKFIKK